LAHEKYAKLKEDTLEQADTSTLTDALEQQNEAPKSTKLEE
jgi:hypothetical protein